MAPILGIYASQISGHLFAPSGAYDSIATATVGAGGASTITFSSIPQTYTHLQIRALTSGTASASAQINFGYNNGTFDNTSSNYRSHHVYGSGSTAAANGDFPGAYVPYFLGGAVTASPGGSIIDILDYTNTNKNKVFREFTGYDANGSGYVTLGSGLWILTNAITDIKFTSSFNQYTQFALYGIKGA